MTNDPFTTARNALDRITELTTHLPTCSTDPMRPDDDHDHAQTALRDALCCLQSDADDPSRLTLHPAFIADYATDDDPSAPFLTIMLDLLAAIIAYDRTTIFRQSISTLALDDSLCPLHFTDYQSCFDDDDPDCSMIRNLFPNHDT